MKQALTISLAVLLGNTLFAQAVTIDFTNSNITGGDLVLLESGSGATDDFSGNRFDELASADFEIQNIAGVGTLGITATALLDDLNVLSGGLADGSNGYDASGEGTTFVFDKDVTITALDWSSFTPGGSDSVTLFNGAANLGTFSDGTVSGTIDFSDTNPATMSIEVFAGDAFTIQWAGGEFQLESMSLTAVPEPGTFGLLAGFLGLVSIMLKRRRA